MEILTKITDISNAFRFYNSYDFIMVYCGDCSQAQLTQSKHWFKQRLGAKPLLELMIAQFNYACTRSQGSLLLTLFNFNPGMDK